MIDLMKKAMFTGVGILSLTKDKVEEVAKDFVEKGNLSEQEGKNFVDEFLKKSNESKEALKIQVETMVQNSLKKMDLASNREISELKKELEEVKALLAEVKKESN